MPLCQANPHFPRSSFGPDNQGQSQSYSSESRAGRVCSALSLPPSRAERNGSLLPLTDASHQLPHYKPAVAPLKAMGIGSTPSYPFSALLPSPGRFRFHHHPGSVCPAPIKVIRGCVPSFSTAQPRAVSLLCQVEKRMVAGKKSHEVATCTSIVTCEHNMSQAVNGSSHLARLHIADSSQARQFNQGVIFLCTFLLGYPGRHQSTYTDDNTLLSS